LILPALPSFRRCGEAPMRGLNGSQALAPHAPAIT
jgi:hypothetical protein